MLETGVRTAGGGFVLGSLPLLVDYERQSVEGLDGTEYEIEVAE